MTRGTALVTALILLAPGGHAQEAAPLSVIDWLSRSVVEPATAPNQMPRAPLNEPPVAEDARSPNVTVTPLDAASADPVGLLASETTGLPPSLWSGSREDVLVTLTRAQTRPALPAMRDLLVTLMLAEADAPMGAGPDADLFLARVDALLALGAIEEAQALLEAADPATPEQFRRYFDVALLSGTENTACARLDARPSVAPTPAASVFCLARNGDWPAAALTLNTHRVLGDLSVEEETLLAWFLDPELFEGEAPPVTDGPVTPLQFRMLEAIGEGTGTGGLPVAFAHADLRDTTAWKAQLDAAERLARIGALDARRLFALYQRGTPAASGGVWDRAAALQDFDAAIRAEDDTAIAGTLPAAWDAARAIRAEVAFADTYAPILLRLALDGDAGDIAATLGLLSRDYETVPAARVPPFLAALARGDLADMAARTPRERTVQDGFTMELPAHLAEPAAEGRLGEALLRTLADFNAGAQGDPRDIAGALAFLRHVGLEDIARRAALQYLLLDRPA